MRDREFVRRAGRMLLRFARQHTLGLVAICVTLAGTSYAAVRLVDRSPLRVCAQRGTGELIAVSTSHGECAGGPLHVGQRGPRGPRGLRGLRGPKGDTGTQGPAGPPAKLGLPLLPGGAAGFSATGGNVDFTRPPADITTILTKSLPPGSFVVQGEANLDAIATSSGYVFDRCTLSDGPTSSPEVQWNSPLASEPGGYFATAIVSVHIAVTTASATTVTLTCLDSAHAGTSFDTHAFSSQIVAIQTSSNS